MENATIHGLPKTLDDLLNNPGDNLTYQDYASDIREILAYNRTQHKDIMSELKRTVCDSRRYNSDKRLKFIMEYSIKPK